jgi:hypothetical protein
MASTSSTRRRLIAVILVFLIVFGRVGVAVLTVGMTAPTSSAPHADPQFEAFKQTCTADPWSYAPRAARGVYHEQSVGGGAIDQICSLYGPPEPSFPAGKWLRDYTVRNCPPPQGARPVDTPPPPTAVGSAASLATPMTAG